MERQLIKVAKELNVGMGTVVEYLHEKGFDVENKPIAKISDAMYDVLAKKFSDSRAEKQKADQIVIGTRPIEKRIIPPVTTPMVQIVAPERKSINLFPPKEPIAPKVEDKPVEVKVTSPEVIERPKVVLPKVVGKIDLNAKPTPPQTAQQPQQTSTPQPQKPPQNNQPKPEFKQPEQPKPVEVVSPKVVEPIKQEFRPQNQPRQDHHHQQQQHQRPAENRQPQPQKVEPPQPQPSVEPDVQDLNVEPELIRAEAPQLRGLKIKGKIDIDKFIEKDKEANRGGGGNKNKRGGRDRDRNRGGNRGERPAAGAVATGSGSGQNAPRQEGGNNESEAARKRKRRRKKVATAGTTDGQSQQQNQAGNNNNRQGDNRQGGGNRQGDNRQGDNRQSGGNRQGDNRHGDNRQGSGNRSNNNGPTEISQQEIEAKIKETMARLNMGGKNRGQKIRRDKRERIREKAEMLEMEQAMDSTLQVTEFISVSDLASLLDVSPTQIITTCMGMGIFVSINQRLDAELIEVIASEFNREVKFISAEEQVGAVLVDEPDNEEDLLPRAPVVTIMGHVDHGKTSLLDYVRSANVASGEAGGITQHIGAYEVKLPDGRKITFLDTPGHEAFTAMRARGAKVTDVAVIIIAADDSIMPQTREAISHAQAAGVPMIFAINKIDKPGADPGKIKNELAQMNILVEEWGGKYQSQDISAKKGIGVDELMEKILLEAELLNLRANPNKRAIGTVIEASLDKGRGYVSKMLVQAGTMKIGDPMVAGEYAGKIKAMYNERGKKVLQAGPATPVLVLGLSGAPQAGEVFKIMPSESEAKEIATKRAQIVREQSARATKRISLDEIGRRLALGTFKELNLIVKGDVDGSVEALSDSLLKQSHETVQVKVIHKAVGAITENDVLLASASDAIVIGFQVRPSINARKLAEREGVEIKHYSVIYEAIDEIRAAIEGMLEPTKEEKITSTIEVREVYKITKVGTVAGCFVQEGKVERKNLLRVIRDGIVVFPVKEGATATFGSLKRYKEDVKEVKHGFECGLTIDNFNDIQVGDFIETYEIIEVKQKLAKV